MNKKIAICSTTIFPIHDFLGAYRRNIQQRIHEIAPFLRLDADPYIVVDHDNMYWLQDAYTTTDLIPYSHRTGGVNYIRNSIKVVVNAYSGETNFYVM